MCNLEVPLHRKLVVVGEVEVGGCIVLVAVEEVGRSLEDGEVVDPVDIRWEAARCHIVEGEEHHIHHRCREAAVKGCRIDCIFMSDVSSYVT